MAEIKQEVASQFELPYADGGTQIPDARIEFDIVERILEAIGFQWFSFGFSDIAAIAAADSEDFSDTIQRVFVAP